MATHESHNRQTFMPPVGFERTISAREGPQNYDLDRAANGNLRYSMAKKSVANTITFYVFMYFVAVGP